MFKDKIKFKEQIANEVYLLDGVITSETNEEYIITCDKYPWKCDTKVVVRKPKKDTSWMVQLK